MQSGTKLWGVAFFGLALACGSGPGDPLDPERITEIAKEEGDAQGMAYSGGFVLRVTGTLTCDCPEVQGVDLCEGGYLRLPTDQTMIEMTQFDGYLQLVASLDSLLVLSGALQQSGAFELGGIYAISNPIGEGGLYVVLQGSFSDPNTFTGELLHRVQGTFDDDALDCRGEVPVEGRRVGS